MGDVAIGIGGGALSAACTSVALRRLGLFNLIEIRLWATAFAGMVGALVTYLLTSEVRP